MNESERDAVKQEFDLFCRIGLEPPIRAAVLATPRSSLGVEPDEGPCPPEARGRMVQLELQVTNGDDELEQIVHMSMELSQFLRLATFLERFDAEQIKAFQGSFSGS